MRRALSKLVQLVRWLAAPEVLASSDPAGSPRGSTGSARAEPDDFTQRGFIQRLFAPEQLLDESLECASESGHEPPSEARPKHGILRFLFAPEVLPAEQIPVAAQRERDAETPRGMSLRRLFARERLEDVDSTQDGGSPAR